MATAKEFSCMSTPSEQFSRTRQRQLLEAARAVYPGTTHFMDLGPGLSRHVLAPDASYLVGHGLLEWIAGPAVSSHTGYRITSKGIDFLEDDGGLSAILGVVTVKLHADTVRELLIQRLAKSPGETTVKGKVREQLKALPAEAIQTLAQRLMQEGLNRLPDAVQWLQTALPTS